MPKKTLLYSLVIFFVFVFFIILVNYLNFLNRKTSSSFDLQVKPGSTKLEIINILNKKLSNDGFNVFYAKMYLFLNRDTQIDAGSYSFKENTNFSQILSGIRNGSIQKKIVFLEGWRVEQNVQELSLNIDSTFASNYYTIAKKHEGYLFPDTYYVDSETTAESIVNKQLKEFYEKTDNLFNHYKGSLTKEEIVKFASIVEREANISKDRKMVAGILIKRYKEGLPLDADATSQYGEFSPVENLQFNKCILNNSKDCTKDNKISINYWPQNLTTEVLNSNNPYNTRGKLGLPPTPISNPSLDSLKSVLEPTNTDYYYYLTDTKGITYYARTLEEHIENIRTYL